MFQGEEVIFGEIPRRINVVMPKKYQDSLLNVMFSLCNCHKEGNSGGALPPLCVRRSNSRERSASLLMERASVARRIGFITDLR